MALARSSGKENAHVAALMNYRSAASVTTSDSTVVNIVQEAQMYATGLKKQIDREAVDVWAREALDATLVQRVKAEV